MNIVATLAEDSYFYGACVLFNSLVANGFDGTFVVGCRSVENMPTSLYKEVQKLMTDSNSSGKPMFVMMPVQTDWHFTNFKPRFMEQVLEAYPECNKITYLDPDIVICAPWHWIEKSAEFGPVVAGDVNWCLPKLHPTRRAWINLMQQDGHQCHNNYEIYFNGGLLAITRQNKEFLQLWHRFIEDYGASTNPLNAKGDIEVWRSGGRWNLMHTPDQDALNMAAMAWPDSVCTFGPDLMGFIGGWLGLPHALGSAKPWRRHYLREALDGRPPRAADKYYWANTTSPIRVFSSGKSSRQLQAIRLASIIARFYVRS